jgi:hypothetical protein
MSDMDEEVKAAHTLIHDALLQEMGICRLAASSVAGDQLRRQAASSAMGEQEQPPTGE